MAETVHQLYPHIFERSIEQLKSEAEAIQRCLYALHREHTAVKARINRLSPDAQEGLDHWVGECRNCGESCCSECDWKCSKCDDTNWQDADRDPY